MGTNDWVYCFVNQSGLFKIGKTKNIVTRLNQLKKEGPYTVCFAKHVHMAHSKVKNIHNLLSKYRTDNNLFDLKNVNIIKNIFELMDGDWYDNQFHNIQAPKPKKEPVCNEEMIKQYLSERKLEELVNLGGSMI